MTPSDSFDPRTWTRGWSPSGAVAWRAPGARTGRTSGLGLALAAAILVTGAVVAYATREGAPAAEVPR